MSDHQQLLDETLDAWQYARRGLLDEARNIPAGDWGFRPTPDNRDVSELLRHILESSAMAVGELTNPAGDFSRQPFPRHIAEHAGHLPETAEPGRWLELLESELQDGLRRLRDAGPDLMMEPITQFNGDAAGRLLWFHHNIAHEMYHRGQLTLYARLTGQVPALTRKIRGDG